METSNNPLPHVTDVYFFGTCVLDIFMPEAGMDAMTLLEQQGIRVHYPQEQSCCGQPAYSAGRGKRAIEVIPESLAHYCAIWLMRWHDETPLARIV